MKKQQWDWRVAVSAIGGLTIIETVALLKNVDGIMFGTVAAAIAGIAGFTIRAIENSRKK